MKNLITFLFILFCAGNSFAVSGKSDTPNSKLDSREIEEFIEYERGHLRGKYKVDVVDAFISKDAVKVERFGNKKRVLNLKGISFSGADLAGAILSMADMTKANLRDANLRDTDLVGVDLTNADIVGADFSNADLSNAVFEGVNLEGVKFDGANLFKASFIKVTGVSGSELADLRKRTKSYYVNLDREPLPEYYD